MGNEIYLIVAFTIFMGGLVLVVKSLLDHTKNDSSEEL